MTPTPRKQPSKYMNLELEERSQKVQHQAKKIFEVFNILYPSIMGRVYVANMGYGGKNRRSKEIVKR